MHRLDFSYARAGITIGRIIASSSSDPDGHIDDLAAQVGNVLANVFGTELVCRTVENIAPTTRRCRQSMAASACRMISRSSFPDRELLD
jgi:hypothetical protein